MRGGMIKSVCERYLLSVEGPTPRAASLIEGILPSAINDSCDNNPVVLSEHEVDLRNVFVAHVLIIVVLVVTLIANAREGKLRSSCGI